MSPSRVPILPRPHRRRYLLALGAAALLATAAPASAATVSIKVTDPSGDQTSGAPTGLDITAATVSQNTSNGAITASVTLAAAPPQGAVFAIGLGLESKDCSIDAAGSMAFLGALDQTAGGLWVYQGDGANHPITPTISGSTFKVASGSAAVLKKLKWDCARISMQMPGPTDDVVYTDLAVANGPSIGGAQVIVLTDKPDGDKDGVPDVADACPTVPGSTSNGCLSIAEKKALRLGARRLVVDKLVLRTGDTCASSAKATVKDGSKTIGKSGALEVGVHGAYCHISGIVKLKKHGKKVKLTVKGTGFKAFRANVK